MRFLLLASVLVTACSTRADAVGDLGRTDLGPRDLGGADLMPGCHWDCLGLSQQCVGGAVTPSVFAPIPCDRWTGTCFVGSPMYTCAQGCRTDGITIVEGTDPRFACEEGRPRTAGDPCGPDAGCGLPATEHVDGGTAFRRLGCDPDAGACVTVPPPDPSSVAAACAMAPLPSAYGVLHDPACAAGLCAFSVCATCTTPCANDWDCPDGRRCISLRDWSADAGTMTTVKACSTSCVSSGL